MMRLRQMKLGKVFPPDDPLSVPMLRLAVLREDVVFELLHLDANREAGDFDRGDVVCTVAYFVRRLAISISSIKDVLVGAQDIGKLLKHDDDPHGLLTDVKRARKAIEPLMRQLQPIRDKVSAHMNPTFCEKVVNNHAEVKGMMQFGDHVKSNFYRLPYMVAFYASHGEVDLENKEQTEAQLRKVAKAIHAGTQNALEAIDGLLAHFWRKHRVLS